MHPNHVQQGHNPSYHTHHQPNGHHHNGHPQPNGNSHHPPPHKAAPSSHKEPIHVLGIPSVTVENNQLMVGDSQSSNFSIHLFFLHYAQSAFPSQVPLAHTPPSRSSVMAPSVQYGYAIGMGRYRPIHPCPPCNVVPAQDQSTQTRDWSQSSA